MTACYDCDSQIFDWPYQCRRCKQTICGTCRSVMGWCRDCQHEMDLETADVDWDEVYGDERHPHGYQEFIIEIKQPNKA